MVVWQTYGGDPILTRSAIPDYRKTDRVLTQSTDYLYLLPHPTLRHWISNYTITFPRVGLMSDAYTVMPHGSATLVFHCQENGIVGNLYGSLSKPVCVGKTANTAAMIFIVEFQPAGYYAFSGIPQKELADRRFPFAQINARLSQLIAEHLERAATIQELVDWVDKLFYEQITVKSYQQEFLTANQMIILHGGQLSVKDISQNVYYSERHLNRLFDQQLGVSVKSFSRLVRGNKALHLLQNPTLSLLQICLQTGFYDLPHFFHDFKATCGITPLEYRQKMSDFYNEIAKF